MSELSDQNNIDAMNARQAQNVDDNRLVSEDYEEFHRALDILYLQGNLSGRLNFLERWPHVARYLFGDELIGFDHDGTKDVERRAALEIEAETRRLSLLDIVETFQARSVEKSVLQTEYVQKTVESLGRDLALLLYAPKIVDRFIAAPAPPPIVQEDVVSVANETPVEVRDELPPVAKAPEPVAAPAVPPAQPIAPLEDDPLDSIHPISVERPADAVDLPEKSMIPKDVLADMKPLASQKMTFMPAKKPEEASVVKPVVPVIGDDKGKPSDSAS